MVRPSARRSGFLCDCRRFSEKNGLFSTFGRLFCTLPPGGSAITRRVKAAFSIQTRMIDITARIEQLGEAKDRSHWTFVRIPAEEAGRISPGSRREFRVKGWLDGHPVRSVCVMPLGDGDFMLPLNAAIRKGTGKSAGAQLQLRLEKDDEPIPLSAELLEGLEEAPEAKARFESYKPSVQRYFSKWVEDAKTAETRIARILRCISALERGLDYGAMLREARDERRELGR